jgi:hypothetical protein
MNMQYWWSNGKGIVATKQYWTVSLVISYLAEGVSEVMILSDDEVMGYIISRFQACLGNLAAI